MYKKSIARVEKENESSQAELSNPALQDIIATNHVVLTKKPREERLSRACKALIMMIIFGLVSIGIIIVTLVLAHSRNALMAIISRSAEENSLSTPNNSRFLINQENSTTITNEQTENENWKKMTTVILTSNNLHTLTTPNLHISSSVMRTTQQYEHISSNTQSQSMKSYPSSNTIVNEQSTTIQTTFSPSTHQPTTMIMMTENKLIPTTQTQEDTSPVIDSTSTLAQETTISIPEETSFTNFINRYFDIQPSTIINKDIKKKNLKLAKKLIEEDIMDDLLFS